MLSRDDNELLCRVGPGTPMGDLMRQYWIPALVSSELPAPDCPPVRVRLLGENLIAFRTTSGAVGLIQNACPHRGASMFFGRNEEEGLRCVYHGWKFDVTGACVDMPSEPAETNFKNKVRARRLPVRRAQRHRLDLHGAARDAAAAAGPRAEHAGHRRRRRPEGAARLQLVQALEGDIDTSHLGFLHLGAVKPEDTKPGSFDYYRVRDRAPRYDVVDTRVRHLLRRLPPGRGRHVLLAHRPLPVPVLHDDPDRRARHADPRARLGADGRRRTHVLEHGGAEHARWGAGPPAAPPRCRDRAATPPRPPSPAAWPVGTGSCPTRPTGSARSASSQNQDNDYLIDREAQRTRSYTGIAGIHQQDQAITESMGPIYDRTQEHLGTSDAMVIRTRRRAIAAAKALRDHGEVPPGVDEPAVYRHRSGGVILPRSTSWLDATREMREVGGGQRADAAAAPAATGDD